MTPPRRREGLTIPWQIIGLLVPILAGVIWLNVQLATMKERVDFLYQLEMQRYPRAGPPATGGDR